MIRIFIGLFVMLFLILGSFIAKVEINVDYLPDGFDATSDNAYQKKMLK